MPVLGEPNPQRTIASLPGTPPVKEVAVRTEFVRQEIDRRFGFRTLSMAAAALTACHFGQVAIPVPVDRPLGLLAIRSCVAKRNSSRAKEPESRRGPLK